MKIKIISSVLILLVAFASCKDSAKKNPKAAQPKVEETESIKPLLAAAERPNLPINNSLYVTAGSGLSLRSGSNLNSKKILTLPYGAQVLVMSNPAHTEMTVAGVDGKMLEIEYQGAQGFAFDGYLSSLAPPQKDEALGDYARRISTKDRRVQIVKKSDKRGEAYGMTTSIELPAKGWNEMYKISQRLFHLPKGIKPDLNGKKPTVTIANINKRERTFTDELTVHSSKNGAIESLVYNYKMRDYNRKVTITKVSNGFKAVEVEESL